MQVIFLHEKLVADNWIAFMKEWKAIVSAKLKANF